MLSSTLWRWALLGLSLVCLLWLLAPVLTPFVVAAVLAYVLYGPVQALHARGLPRVMSVLLVEVLALALAAGLLLLVVPVLMHELPLLREQLPKLALRFNEAAAPWLQKLGLGFTLDVAAIKAFTLKVFGTNAEELMSAALSSLRIGGSLALAVIGNLVLLPVALFYLLMDAPRLVQAALELVPPRFQQQALSFVSECDELLGQYMRGQVLVMLALAVFYVAGLSVVGLELAWPVGLFTGLAIFVPYLGFGLGLCLALLAAALQFGTLQALLTVGAVYGLGQLLESFLLTPRLVGERIGLSPLAVIFALLAFGHLLGFVGVLMALPASAVTLVVLRHLRSAYLGSDLYRGSQH